MIQSRVQRGELAGLAGAGGNAVGYAKAETYHLSGLQFAFRSMRDDPALQRHLSSGRVDHFGCFTLMAPGLRGFDHNMIDPGTRQAHFGRGSFASPGLLAHLHQHPAAAIARRHCQHHGIELRPFLAKIDVAVRVGCGAAHNRNIDRQGQKMQVLLALKRDNLRQWSGTCRPTVHRAAVLPRIDKGADADFGEQSGPPCAALPDQMLDDAAGQGECLDALTGGQLLHGRRPGPVRAYHAPDHAFVRDVIEAAHLAVADSLGMNQRQVARMPAGQKPRAECGKDRVGLKQAAARPGYRNRRPVRNCGNCLGS